MQLDDAATILGRADFFEVCDAEQRRLLAFASERKKFRPGTVCCVRRCARRRACADLGHGIDHAGWRRRQSIPHSRPGRAARRHGAGCFEAPACDTEGRRCAVETLFVPRWNLMKLANQYTLNFQAVRRSGNPRGADVLSRGDRGGARPDGQAVDRHKRSRWFRVNRRR